jgi:hypothetical protein
LGSTESKVDKFGKIETIMVCGASKKEEFVKVIPVSLLSDNRSKKISQRLTTNISCHISLNLCIQ